MWTIFRAPEKKTHTSQKPPHITKPRATYPPAPLNHLQTAPHHVNHVSSLLFSTKIHNLSGGNISWVLFHHDHLLNTIHSSPPKKAHSRLLPTTHVPHTPHPNQSQTLATRITIFIQISLPPSTYQLAQTHCHKDIHPLPTTETNDAHSPYHYSF